MIKIKPIKKVVTQTCWLAKGLGLSLEKHHIEKAGEQKIPIVETTNPNIKVPDQFIFSSSKL